MNQSEITTTHHTATLTVEELFDILKIPHDATLRIKEKSKAEYSPRLLLKMTKLSFRSSFLMFEWDREKGS